MTKKIDALVPMKGHSQRVPMKNLRKFCGRPLFCRIIDALLGSRQIGRVWVDTDSKAIKALVKKHYGKKVNVIDRPKAIRGDGVSMNRIIAHDIGLIDGDHFLQAHSTSPLLTPATIDRAVSLYFKGLAGGYDSLFGVTRYQARFYDGNFKPVNHSAKRLIKTQDLPPLYMDNSCFYIFSRRSFGARSNRIGRKPYLFEVPKAESIDIDDEEDLLIAEKVCAKG